MPACRKRRRISKNNERLAHAAKAGNPAPEDVQDQGFTRPTILILLPFRSSAMRWLEFVIVHTPLSFQFNLIDSVALLRPMDVLINLYSPKTTRVSFRDVGMTLSSDEVHASEMGIWGYRNLCSSS